MSDKLMPIITGLIIGPAALPATISIPTPASIESTLPSTTGIKSSALRKIRFESAYQSNLISIQQVGVAKTQYVGELQERWQFPSDHLPIGMTIDGLNIASWNVLNSEYMSWVTEKNSQGLSRSQIAQEHIYLDGTKLTVRDLHVIECIKSMLAHPTHPRPLISLQECSQDLIEELQKQLPEEYGIILSSETPLKDQNIVIYDKRVLDFDPSRSKIESGVFSTQPDRTVMNLCFVQKEGGQTFRVINCHLPGEPGNPAPAELAAYAASVSTPNVVTIAMGDMNFNEVEMGDAFQQSTPNGYNFNLVAPYCTNIGLNLHSKSIDHFLIYSQGQHAITSSTAEETMVGLEETVHLLEPDFFICNEGT